MNLIKIPSCHVRCGVYHLGFICTHAQQVTVVSVKVMIYNKVGHYAYNDIGDTDRVIQI